MFCSKCGARLTEGAQFCPSCGAPVPAAAPSAPPASPAIESPSPAPQYAPNPYAPSAVPPYVPPSAVPPVPGWAARPRVDYAGFWLRFVAWLIDSIVWGIPIFFIVCIVAVFMGVAGAFKNIDGETPGDVAGAMGAGFLLLAFSVFLAGRWLYYGLMESSAWQATLGKKALGLYVTDLSGNRINFSRATGRFFGRLVSGLIPLEIGYIMAGFTEKRQALHDMIASCLVLRKL